MICKYLWVLELMAVRDENARRLKNCDYNMRFVHMILDLLRLNESQGDLVHGIKVEFLWFERSALDRARVQNAEVDAAVKKLQSAFLDEVLLQDGDCSLM